MPTRFWILLLPLFIAAMAVYGLKPEVAATSPIGGEDLSELATAKTENVEFVGNVKVPSYAVSVQGDYAYVVGGFDGGFRIINVSDPTAPVEVGFVNTADFAMDVKVVGNYAYVADDAGLNVIDVSNPTSPMVVGKELNYADSVAIQGHYAYVISGGSMKVINIIDPTAPDEVSSFGSPSANDIAVKEKYAYIAALGDGIRLLNINNPNQPIEVGSFTATYGWASHVAPVGNHVFYVSESGMGIIDASNPAAPFEIGFTQIPTDSGGRGGLQVDGNYAYVTGGDQGLTVVNIENPSDPKEAGSYYMSSVAQDVDVNSGYVYVANRENGLFILRFDDGTPEPIFIPMVSRD